MAGTHWVPASFVFSSVLYWAALTVAGIAEEGRESPVIHGGDASPALRDKHLF